MCDDVRTAGSVHHAGAALAAAHALHYYVGWQVRSGVPVLRHCGRHCGCDVRRNAAALCSEDTCDSSREPVHMLNIKHN